MKVRLLLGLAILLAGLASVQVSAQIASPAYRYTTFVTNNTGSTITDSFVPIYTGAAGVVDAANLVSGGFIQADGDDIEFIKGEPTWFGSAQDLDSAAAVWWARINALADGDTRNIDIFMGDPAATVATVDQGLGLNNVAADNVTVNEDNSLDPSDDFYFEIDVEIFDNTASASDVPLGRKGVAYGFVFSDSTESYDSFIIIDADDGNYNSGSGGCTGAAPQGTALLGKSSSSTEWSGLFRYQNLAVPQGSTVTNVVFSFIQGATESNTVTRWIVFAHDTDNAPQPPTQSAACANPRTTAQIAWEAEPGWTLGNADTMDVDITSVIQEIIDRPGWNPGNSILIQIENNGGTLGAIRRIQNLPTNNGARLRFDFGSTGPLELFAQADGDELNESWDGTRATWRLWYSSAVPIFALTKDGVWVASNNAISGTIPDNASAISYIPARLNYIRDMRLLTSIALDYSNLVTNPSIETNTTGYTAESASSIASTTTNPQFGSNALEIVTNGAGGLEGARFSVTSTTSAGAAFRAGWSCVGTGTYTFRFWDDSSGGTFYAGDQQTLSSAVTRFDTNATFDGGSADRRITITRNLVAGEGALTIQCDGLQVSTGLGAARTYIDGSIGSNFVWDAFAHASISHKMEDDSEGTEELILDFEPANLAQTDPGDSGDGFTWEGTIADIGTAGNLNAATYLITQDFTALTSTVFAFQINADNAFQGQDTETPIDVVPTPSTPPNFGTEGTGSGHILFNFTTMIADATAFTTTVIWYAVATFSTVVTLVILWVVTRGQYWITLMVSTFVLVTFMLAGAIGFWVIFPWLAGGILAGLSERIPT